MGSMYQLYHVRSSLAKITVSGFVALPLFSAWQWQSQWHPMAALRPSVFCCFFALGCLPFFSQTPTCFRPRKDWTSYNLQLSFKFDSLREFFPKWILDPWYINDMYHILSPFFSLPSYFYIQSTPVQRLPLQKQNLLLGSSTVSSWWVSLRSWISTSWPCLTLSWACWNYSEPLDP